MTDETITPKSIFAQALEFKSLTERAAYLDQVCGGNADLRARVVELLNAHDQLGSFLESRPEQSETITYNVQPPTEPIEIGPYKLLQRIGQGGMGVVYMAEQRHPVRRKVALKVIKPGIDNRQVILRFEAERQALALMDHPNIARVLDGGTTPEGLPYFVMELVKGIPITKYCDQIHLTLQQRLELFIPVCHAVQHAHQKGVIHRDLKPSNVLVAQFDGAPVPKIIDFGVAKAAGSKLTDQTMYTEFGAIVGTLEYMSPEQAEFNQLDIDTRSDVYSLGVLLYELLTGSTPFDQKRFRNAALLEVLRFIREEEPQKPSTRLSTAEELPSIAANRGLEPRRLSGLIRGELDWIVMRALEKNRNRRYETANGLATDIQRYLSDEPVTACPPSLLYRIRKLARKHKSVFAIAGLVVLGLLIGVVGLVISNRMISHERDAKAVALEDREHALQAAQKAEQNAKLQRDLADTRRTEAEREKERADHNYATARAAVDNLYTRVSNELRGQPRVEQIRRELLEEALKFYQGFVREQNADVNVLAENGLAYLRVADLHCLLGRWADGIKNYEQAITIFTGLVAAHSKSANWQDQIAHCRLRYTHLSASPRVD